MLNRVLAFALAVVASASAQEASSQQTLMQSLNSTLLNSNSATATLETWCRDHRLASVPRIVALVVPKATRAPSADTLARLNVTSADDVKYRQVQLQCGSSTLSKAENWYVPRRLTADMNRVLETTDTPFGRAVASLVPYRKTIETKMLWSGQGIAPDALFEHRAVLYTREHLPFAEVVETYQREVLGK